MHFKILSFLCAPPCASYTSIPQVNRTQQKASISSLGLYATISRFFLALAPTAQGFLSQCNYETYSRRGWYVSLPRSHQIHISTTAEAMAHAHEHPVSPPVAPKG